MRFDRTLLVLLAAALAALGGALALQALRGGETAALLYPGPDGPLLEPGPAPAAPAATQLPDVRVEIEPVARILELPPPPQCRLRRPGEAAALPARVDWLAGSAAVPFARERARGAQLVRLVLAGGDALYRVVHLDVDGAAEVALEGPFAFHGHVAGEDGAPVAGARVWLAGRPEVATAADGTFVVEGLRSRSGLPLVVRAPGYADHFQVVEIASPDRAPPVFVLERGAALQVRFAGALPAGGRPTVWTRPARRAGQSEVSLLHYPFFRALLDDTAVLGPDGACTIEGLPAGAEIEVVVHHPLVAAAPVAVALRADRQTVVVPGKRGPSVRGAVRDAAGAAAAGVLVVSRGDDHPLDADDRPGVLLPAPPQLAALAYDLTGSDGSFALARRSGTRPERIAVLPPSGPGLEQEVRAERAVDDVLFELPPPGEAEGRPRLQLVAGAGARLHVVRGRVQDAAVELRAGQSYALPLREPAVLDVRVVGPQGEGERYRLAVRGVVELQL